MNNKFINFILAFLYIILFLILQVILNGLLIRIFPSIYNIISILIIIITYCIIKKDELIKDIKNIKNANYKKNIIIFLIMFIITETCSIIFPKVFNIMVTNQNNIINNIETNGIITFIESILLAPIYEEILFRKNFKKSFTNKWLFIIITGILFGSMHLLTIQNIKELIYAPLYITLGLSLSYIYYNDDNILSSIKYHMLNNLLAFIIILFI